MWLSKDAKEVVGIEIVESAVEDARKNAHMNGVENCRFHVGDVIYFTASKSGRKVPA
ncbi:MAG: methyltransferase domain-containing protein [Desulfamplus sp.]|nr:methyltransferase domain-containing protein [Desulfamplus sp.]